MKKGSEEPQKWSKIAVPPPEALYDQPRGPKDQKKIEIENFEREQNFRASHPPRPYFCGGNRDVEIENFERDLKIRSKLKISSEIEFFWSLSEEPKRVVSKRVVSADVPPERKPERGYVRQNRPFTKPPCYLPVTPFGGNLKGWFPKGWFRRMFPRNENRNEGTFAKTALLPNRPFISQWHSLRAKGALISEPRFSTPCEMRFFPREKGKTAFLKKNPRQRPFSLSRVGRIAFARGRKSGLTN